MRSSSWNRIYNEGYLIAEIWGDRFGERTDDGDWPKGSPLQYRNGGLGHTQWLNWDTGAAVLLIADNGWREGGYYHMFYAPPPPATPFEVKLSHPSFRSDPEAWQRVYSKCEAEIEDMLGLRADGP